MSFFGQQSNTGTGQSTGGMFSGNSAFGAKPATPSLFGTANNTSNTAPGTGNPSGQAPAAPASTTFGFGTNNPPATGATPATNNNIFGSSFGSAPASGTGGSASIFGGNIFGGAKPATPTPAPTTGATNPLFGNTGTNPLFGGTPGATNTPTPAATPAAPGGLLFGGSTPATGLFGGTKPAGAGASTTASAAPSGNMFGQTSATGTSAGTSTAPAALSGGFFNLPSKPADPQGTTAAATGTTGAATSSGGLFASAKPATGASGTSGTAPAAPTLPTFNLGGNAPKDGASTAAPAAAPSSLFNLGGAKPEEKKDEKKDGTAAPPTFNLFGSGDKKTNGASTTAAPVATTTNATPAAASSSTAAAPVTVSVAPPSMLRGKTIEEIVNRWSTELETHVKDFNKFASEVAVWDRALIENGNNLARLYATVLAAEREQNDIDQSLDHIEQQQKDLAATLDAYEKSTEEILGGQGSSLRVLDTGPADTERDKSYMLATELHGHLDDLSGSLMQMIDSVNALTISPGATNGQTSQDGSDDPMGQIAQILSSHLESLQWIDGAVRELDTKVSDVERRVRVATEGGLGSSTKLRGYGLR